MGLYSRFKIVVTSAYVAIIVFVPSHSICASELATMVLSLRSLACVGVSHSPVFHAVVAQTLRECREPSESSWWHCRMDI